MSLRILDWYIGRTIITYTLLVIGVLVGLFSFVAFIDELTDLGVGNYTLYQVIRYTVLTIPQRVHELLPMAALLGTILGLSSLAQLSELVVMRAAGISLLRIVAAVMKAAGVFVLANVILSELITPWTETVAQRGRAEALQESVDQQTDYGLWMRDQGTFINVGEVLPDLTLLDVRVFEFDETRHIRSVVHAKEGIFDKDTWRLSRVRQSLFTPDRVTSRVTEQANWKSTLAPDILQVFLVRPEQLSLLRLDRYIDHLEDNRQETSRYKLAYWQKIVAPFAVAVMVILAIPFVFGQMRSGSFGRNLFVGIMLGLGFFLANKGFGYVVLVYGIPAILGAVLPTLAFLLAALILVRQVG